MCQLASPAIEYIAKSQGNELNLCAMCFGLLFPVVMLLLCRLITMHISMFVVSYSDEGDSLKL